MLPHTNWTESKHVSSVSVGLQASRDTLPEATSFTQSMAIGDGHKVDVRNVVVTSVDKCRTMQCAYPRTSIKQDTREETGHDETPLSFAALAASPTPDTGLHKLKSIVEPTFPKRMDTSRLPRKIPSPALPVEVPSQPLYSIASLLQYLCDLSKDLIPSSSCNSDTTEPFSTFENSISSGLRSDPPPGSSALEITPSSFFSAPASQISPSTNNHASPTILTSQECPSTRTSQQSTSETIVSSSITLMSLPSTQFTSDPMPTSTDPVSSRIITVTQSSNTIPNSSVKLSSTACITSFPYSISATLSLDSSSSRMFASSILTTTSAPSEPSSYTGPATIALSSFPSTHVETLTQHSTTQTSSSTTHNGQITTSTSFKPGVLSTSNPKEPSGFARNTAAIVSVAVAGTSAIIIAVIAIFFACKRYKRRRPFGASRSYGGLPSVPWHPPLAGDEEPHYYPDYRRQQSSGSLQHLGSVTHTNEMAHSGTELLSTERSMRGPNSSESSFFHPTSPSFAHQPSIFAHMNQDTPLSIPKNAYIPPIPPPTSWPRVYDGGHDEYGRKNRDATSSSLSLHAGPSSHGHKYTDSSSHGHVNPTSSSHGHINSGSSYGHLYSGTSSYEHEPASTTSGNEFLFTKSSPRPAPTSINPASSSHGHINSGSSHRHVYSGASSHEHGPASFTSANEFLFKKSSHTPAPTTFKEFIGRLRPGGGSLPSIIIHKTSNSNESSSSHNVKKPPALQLSLDRPNKPVLGPIEPAGLWPTATLPSLPSPTATDNSRMLEDLLTPHLGTRIASSEHSSSASLRDHVDYSRPISGAIRNGAQSSTTFHTDPDTIVS